MSLTLKSGASLAEMGALGYCLRIGRLLPDVANLSPDNFSPVGAWLFEALLGLTARDLLLDQGLVAQELERTRAALDNPPDVAAVLREALEAAPAEESAAITHAAAVRDDAGRRLMRATLQSALERAADPATDPGAARAEVLENLLGIDIESKGGRRLLGPAELLERFEAERQAMLDPESLPLATMGLPELDRSLGPSLRPGRMIVVGARPGAGKTTLGLQATRATLEAGGRAGRRAPVLFFSLEMDAPSLLAVLGSMASGVNRSGVEDPRLYRGLVENQKESFLRAVREQTELGLFVCDAGAMTAAEMETQVVRVSKQEGPPALVVVDYLGLMRPGSDTPKNASKVDQVSSLSNGLRLMAKRLPCPLLVLCQLNRVSGREKRAPQLEDLRDSGAIEQDAHAVLGLWRPPRKDGAPGADGIEVRILKQRAGSAGAPIWLRWDGARARIESPTQEEVQRWKDEQKPPSKPPAANPTKGRKGSGLSD